MTIAMTNTCGEGNNTDSEMTTETVTDSMNNEKKNNDKKIKKAVKRKAETSNNDPSISDKKFITTISNEGINNKNENSAGAKCESEITEEKDAENLDRLTDKEAIQINGKSLRSSFNSPEGLTMLKKFVAICNDKKKLDLASQYLSAGGSALEILKLLDSTDKKNVGNATIVFSAMEIVIMKILEKYPQYNSSAAEACRYLVNSHLSSIHSMLSSQSNAKQRKVVLRLLTAVVSLGGTLPRELLGHLSLHSQVLDTLSKHTEPTDPQSVRTSFVHFILSFLVEGNLSVVRALLDKKGAISCIFPGLIYDSHNLVNLVLTTMRNYVLENPGISKTIKLHTFSTPVVQSLVSLYNWKGPKNWPGKNHKKHTEDAGHTDPEEKRIVVDVLHEFLLTLLTSNKFGIIFHDRLLGTAGQKNNQLADTILQSLDRPWEHEKPADLVTRILVACPDLIRPQISYTESFLEPSASRKWILLIKFIQKILESLDPEVCLKPCLSELRRTPQIFSALTNLTVPQIALKNGITPAINNSSIVVRHASLVLLKVMLKQLKDFVKTVENNCADSSEIPKIKNMISDYLLKNIPSLDSILTAWNKALSPEEEVEIEGKEASASEAVPPPTVEESLTTILDLLMIYQEVCPQLLENSTISNSDKDATTLLTSLNTLVDIEADELGRMKVKALQFLLALDSSAFTAKKKLFSKVIPFLVSLLDIGKESTPVNSHARNAMKKLFYNSGVFEGCGYQADIWIGSLLEFDEKEERVELANWLVQIIRKTFKNFNNYVDLIARAEGPDERESSSETKIEDVLADLMERVKNIERNRTARLLPSASISPLLVAALENANNDGRVLLMNYLSKVTAHTLHCQVSPNALIRLVDEFEKLPSRVYISSWKESSDHLNAKKLFGSKSATAKLSKGLLTRNKIDANKIFNGERKVSFRIGEEEFNIEHSMNPDEVLASFRISLFYFTRLTQEKKFDDESEINFKIVFLSLFHITKDLESYCEGLNLSDDCCRWILSHPNMLRYFSPLYSRENLIEKYSTELLAFICPIIVDLFGEKKMSDLLIPFKEKFIARLLSAVEKLLSGGNIEGSPDAVRFVEILQLDIKDVIKILQPVIQLPIDKLTSDEESLSVWGSLVPKLLTASITQREDSQSVEFITLDEAIVKKISQLMISPNLSKTKGFDSWIQSLFAHLKRFPHNIAAIDNNFFLSLIRGKVCAAKIELASYLANRNPCLISVYVKFSLHNMNVLKNKEAVFTILSNMGDHRNIQKEFWTRLYDLYKNEILRWFSDPESVDSCIKKNVKAAVRLIETVMDPETCDKTCDMILSNGDKLLSVDESYIELLKVVFRRARGGGDKNVGENRLVDFAQILIHVIVSSLKKDSKNNQRHENLCKTLQDILRLVGVSSEGESPFREIRKNHSWPQFTRFSLKLGLKLSPKENENGKEKVKLLGTLTKLCNVVYENNCDDEYVKTIFEMTTSHSEFINVMLGASETKRDLVELLLTLVKKNNSLMASSHVPLYLGAYNATLSESDQLILQLLQYYETNNTRLTDYRPYLWGSAAASHYSVKSGTDTALWRQPSTSQVLDLFLQDIVDKTIKNYPIRRKMRSAELHPPQSTYDPAFYLPLLCYLLSDNSVIACHKITQSGALALVLSACGSIEREIRLAALTVISRFYYHLEATNSKEKLLWLHFIDIFRNGISSSNLEVDDVQLSSLVSTFLAQTSLVATQPLNPLYSPLQRFLMAKPVLDLNSVPEFLQLFHSSDVDHKIQRYWILEIVRDGLKTNIDAKIAFRLVLFKMLFAFYSSSLADRHSKNLILQVINSVSKIQNACILLVTGYGLLPWLEEIIYSSETEDSEFVTVFIDTLRNVFESLMRSNEKGKAWRFMLLRTMLILMKYLSSKNLDIESYRIYVTTIEKLVSSMKAKRYFKILNTKSLTELVQLSKNILLEVNECEDILQFGSKFFSKCSYSNSNYDDGRDYIAAKDSLKKLLIVCSSNK